MKSKNLFIAIAALLSATPCIHAATDNNHSQYPSFYYYYISNALGSLPVQIDESRNSSSGPSSTLSPGQTERHGGSFSTITDNLSLASTGEKICQINVTQYGIASIQNLSTKYTCRSNGDNQPTVTVMMNQ